MRYVLMACVLLAGCAQAERETRQAAADNMRYEMKRVAEERTAACQAPIPSVKGRMAERWRCFTAAHESYYRTIPNGDLFIAAGAQILSAMAQFDAGRISWEEADAMRARASADLTTQGNLRLNSQIGAAAAVAGSAPVFVPPQWPTYRPPVQTNCFRAGNTVTCSSY